MRAAVAAVLACCAVHAGIAGAVAGWSVGSWAGVPVAAAPMAVIVVVMRRRTCRSASPLDVGRTPARTP